MFDGLWGILGVIVGTILTAFYMKQQGKYKLAISLFVSYNSLDFISVRNSAGSILREVFDNQNELTWSNLHTQLQEGSKWEKVSAVDGFFRTLHELCENNLIDKTMARSLFKDIHNHWYVNYFEIIDLESGNSSGTHKKLHSFLNKS